MLNDLFATKTGMTQAWTRNGKRLAVTRCIVGDNIILGKQEAQVLDKKSQNRKTVPCTILEVGYGTKKLKNVTKPLRSRLEKGGFTLGIGQIEGVRVFEVEADNPDLQIGQTITADQVLSVGDVVQVQGVSKGKGFTGAVKRYGFAGGPKTHGQSDRHRAVGSIGAGTTPGRVWPGKKMPGRHGTANITVRGLVVLYIDPETGELWLSGPVPGSINGSLRITKMGEKRNLELDKENSGIPATPEPKEEGLEEAVNAEAVQDEVVETEQPSETNETTETKGE